MVELGPEHAGLGPRGTRDGIDPDPLHEREIEHEAGIAHRVAGHVVSPAPDGEDEFVLAGEVHGGDDVGHPGTAHDQRRVAVDHGVPELTDGVIVRVAGLEELTT
jgi:hypothetical protein